MPKPATTGARLASMERLAQSARVAGADDLASFGWELPELPASSAKAAGFSAARSLRNGDVGPGPELSRRVAVDKAGYDRQAAPADWVL